MKLTVKRIRKIRKAIDKGRSVQRIAQHYGYPEKSVQEAYDQYLLEQIANSPRVRLAKMITALEATARKALDKYNLSRHSQDAFAVTSITNEIRSTVTELQKMVDVSVLTDQFIDDVMKKLIIAMIKMFVTEVNGIRAELANRLDAGTNRTVNEALLECMDVLKRKVNPIYLEALEGIEKSLNVDLTDRKKELLMISRQKEIENKTGTEG